MILLSFLARKSSCFFYEVRSSFHDMYLATKTCRTHQTKKQTTNRHALRKSGVYTALDFAPSPRFHNDPSRPGSPLVPPNASFNETGSVRSQSASGSRSRGMSPMGIASARNGSNGVETLPKSTVGTMQDLNQELKPKWDIGR